MEPCYNKTEQILFDENEEYKNQFNKCYEWKYEVTAFSTESVNKLDNLKDKVNTILFFYNLKFQSFFH